MSDLVAIAYPDVATALQVRDRLLGLQRENLIELEDAAVVEKRLDGRIKLRQVRGLTGACAAWGAAWGGLIGMVFFVPLLGMAMGAGAGALGAVTTDHGIDDGFMRDLGASLQPGGAVLFLLIVRSTPDRIVPKVAAYGGKVIRTPLSREQEDHLREMALSSAS